MIVADRYELEELLGQGGFGATHAARDRETGERVAIKELDMSRVSDWKSLELFERESRVLSELDHPGIPAYVDAFELEGEGGASRFFLVQQLAPGKPLSEPGWRPRRAEVIDAARQLLNVCRYLHGVHPPIIHRDIKPANVVRAPSGEIALVDFGAARVRMEGELGGSTMVGTMGYMAPEQLRGVADARSDLYGVGATLVWVLSRLEPEELPTTGLAIDTSTLLPDDPRLAEWLDRMIAPDPSARFASAQDALDALDALDVVDASRKVEPSPYPDPPAPDEEPEEDDALDYGVRPQEGSEEWIEGTTVSSHLLGLSGAALTAFMCWMIVASGFEWGGAIIGPCLLAFSWVMMYGGWTPKTISAFPRSKLLESRGSMAAAQIGTVALTASFALGWISEPTGLLYYASMAGVGFMAFLSWVVTAMEYEATYGWRYQEDIERELGVVLPLDPFKHTDLPFRLDDGVFKLGHESGHMPWVLFSLGTALSVALGTVASVMPFDAFMGAYEGGVLCAVLALAAAPLVALWRKGYSADRLTIDGERVRARHGGSTKETTLARIARWEVTSEPKGEETSEDDTQTHTVRLTLHTLDGDTLVYEDVASGEREVEAKRRITGELIAGRLGERRRPLEAVQFDFEGIGEDAAEQVVEGARSAAW